MKGLTLEKKISNLEYNDNLYESKNPLRLLFQALIVFTVIILFNIFTGGGFLARKFGLLTAYAHQIITLLVILSFCLCYHKQSIWAWWIALAGGPIYWMILYAFLPIGIPVVIISIFINMIVVGYLISKYKKYKNYIMKQDT